MAVKKKSASSSNEMDSKRIKGWKAEDEDNADEEEEQKNTKARLIDEEEKDGRSICDKASGDDDYEFVYRKQVVKRNDDLSTCNCTGCRNRKTTSQHLHDIAKALLGALPAHNDAALAVLAPYSNTPLVAARGGNLTMLYIGRVRLVNLNMRILTGASRVKSNSNVRIDGETINANIEVLTSDVHGNKVTMHIHEADVVDIDISVTKASLNEIANVLIASIDHVETMNLNMDAITTGVAVAHNVVRFVSSKIDTLNINMTMTNPGPNGTVRSPALPSDVISLIKDCATLIRPFPAT